MKHKLLCTWVIIAFLTGGIVIPAFAGEAPAPRSPMSQPSQDSRETVAAHYGMGDYRSNPPGELLIADAVILRPLGLVSCAIGLVSASILTFPWAATSNSYDRVDRELVQKPFKYTFERPLGDLDY